MLKIYSFFNHETTNKVDNFKQHTQYTIRHSKALTLVESKIGVVNARCNTAVR